MKYKQCINCKKKKIRPILGDKYSQISERIYKRCKEGYASQGRSKSSNGLFSINWLYMVGTMPS